MGNSRTDLGEDFIASGMTLITDPRSDFYLNEDKKKKLLKEVVNDPGEECNMDNLINKSRKLYRTNGDSTGSRAFKDISLSFDPHPVTKDLPILKNTSAIRRSIMNLVQTIPEERFFQPLLGSDVRSSLFDFVDFATASVIQAQILETIENFEPRVANTVVEVDPEPDLNSFDVTVIFDIVGLEFPTQEFSFLLEAAR